jgi:hypothetical protein
MWKSLGNVGLLLEVEADTLLALRQPEQTLTMLASNLTIDIPSLSIKRPVSRENIVAVAIRAFHKCNARSRVRRLRRYSALMGSNTESSPENSRLAHGCRTCVPAAEDSRGHCENGSFLHSSILDTRLSSWTAFMAFISDRRSLAVAV